MKAIGKINAIISKILSVLMIVLFIWMIVAFSIQVFARYIFSAGFTWTEELTRYGMIWMVFLGAAWIIFNSDHVKVTILEDAFKGQSRKILMIIQDIFGLIFVAAIFYFSFSQLSIAARGVSANTGISNVVQYMVFPISMILSAWGYITRIVMQIGKKEDAEAQADQEGGNE